MKMSRIDGPVSDHMRAQFAVWGADYTQTQQRHTHDAAAPTGHPLNLPRLKGPAPMHTIDNAEPAARLASDGFTAAEVYDALHLGAKRAGWLPAQAAAVLLTGTSWMDRPDFLRHVHMTPALYGDPAPTAWVAHVDWAAALADLESGDLYASHSAAELLRLAASFAGKTQVNLADALGPLDLSNTRLVIDAVHAIKEDRAR